MAKIAKKLTDTEIKSTKLADKEINLFDGDGLILRIAPLSKEERRIGISGKQCQSVKKEPK